jgi:hypothetical protein
MMLVAEGRVVSLERAGDVELQQTEVEAARSSLATGAVVRGDVYPNLASCFDFWPLKTSGAQNVDERSSEPDALVNIVATVLAPVINRPLAAGAPLNKFGGSPL